MKKVLYHFFLSIDRDVTFDIERGFIGDEFALQFGGKNYNCKAKIYNCTAINKNYICEKKWRSTLNRKSFIVSNIIKKVKRKITIVNYKNRFVN